MDVSHIVMSKELLSVTCCPRKHQAIESNAAVSVTVSPNSSKSWLLEIYLQISGVVVITG